MKFTLSWLKDHLDTGASLDEITAKLTGLGLEVEGVENQGANLRPFIVAAITHAEQHPNADRLRVCTVDTGSGMLQVVCGAPNARAGIKVPLARPGDVIPATGKTLTAGNIRGTESQGMLCSGRELGLSDDQDGIMELPETAQVGQSLADALALNDPVIEIAITPNRADCAGVYGVARDLAAGGLGTCKPLDRTHAHNSFTSPVHVHIADEAREACPLFVGRTIRGVTNRESPQWLQDRLRAIGLRPISALVDITNYITFDLGRPLHVFDTGRLQGDLTIRFARDGEELAALNGRTYRLKPHHLVIADEGGVDSLAGVMGGEATGCTAETTSVFLEVALFDPRAVAVAGRDLQITSDARYRFERGLDPAFLRDATEIATRMILDLCGGEASETVSAGHEPHWRRELTLRAERVKTLGGVDIAPERQLRLLETIGCRFEGTTIIPPSWRADIVGEADLVEEILRLNGFDNIPETPLPRRDGTTKPALSSVQKRLAHARRLLAARGLNEAVSFAFMSSATSAKFTAIDPSLILANPISADLDGMRPTILPNLIAAAARNAARGAADIGLFEVGPVFTDKGQSQVAALVRTGDTTARGWTGAAKPVDAFAAKADVMVLLAALGAPDALTVEATAPAWYHPGRSGTVKLGHRPLAYFGEIHPALAAALDCPLPCAMAEVFLDTLPEPKRKGTERPLLALSPFQPVKRDFAFVVVHAVGAEALLKAIRSADKTLITSAEIFDVYTGKGVDEGRKSIAVGSRVPAARGEPDRRTDRGGLACGRHGRGGGDGRGAEDLNVP